MARITKSVLHRHAGFGLTEIMVGLIIGMLAAIIMMQVFAVSEERKRTTTSGGDALSNGAITFFQLQQDISQSGYGFSVFNMLNCPLRWTVNSGSGIATAIPLAPVTIIPYGSGSSLIPDGDPNTDALLILTGNANGEPQGNKFNESPTGPVYKVQMPSAFAQGDRVIAAPDSCAGTLLLDAIQANPPDGATTVTVVTGVVGTATALYNLGGATPATKPRFLAYAIRGGNLTVCDYLVNDCGLAANAHDSSVWVPIATNIVSLRAQYGRDTASPVRTQAQIEAITPRPVYIVDTYDQTIPTTACTWTRAPAVRLALVARNSQFNKTTVTTNAPEWAGSTSTPIDVSKNPDGSANANWGNYRYKVFQAVIPLRNVVWIGAQAGC